MQITCTTFTRAAVAIMLLAVIGMVTLDGVEAMPYLNYRNSERRQEPARQSRSRTYDEIARVINPNPYAGGVGLGVGPFPAQPFWTYAG